MAQGIFPFQYEIEKKDEGMTGLAGLPAYVEFAQVMRLGRMLSDNVQARHGNQGWTDEQVVMTLVLLNLAGGDCAANVVVLEGDDGFCQVLRGVEHWGRTGSEKRALSKRWRKKRMRTMPSPPAIREYLELFHYDEQEKLRVPHTAFIHAPKMPLAGLVRATAAFVAGVQRRTPEKTATVDMDATIVETHKREALYCYKNHKAYQPLNIYWAEQVNSSMESPGTPYTYHDKI
jgi:hypothetical protein